MRSAKSKRTSQGGNTVSCSMHTSSFSSLLKIDLRETLIKAYENGNGLSTAVLQEINFRSKENEWIEE